MPKSQYVDPKKQFEKRTIKFKDVKVCDYDKTIKDEMKNFSKEDFLAIYADMVAIREFESMLMEIKTKGNYNQKEFTYPGPAHLALGEESSAVGEAFLLGVDDFVFGSHRSHHEVIAKAMSAIRKLPDDKLEQIMREFNNGVNYETIKKHSKTTDIKELAREFFIYGIMCELFAKDCGFSRGLGGSMHAFFLPFGIFPNNAIVGGSGPIAAGAALFKKCNQKPGVVIANLGDGSAARGPVLESLNFAAMDQYTQLWEDGYKGGLPIIFNFSNNSYGMGGQTKGETMAYDDLVRLGVTTPSQMHCERVNGWNPLAVIDAYRRKLELIKEGKGPVLLDVVTYRMSGHSTSDISSYRTQEEIDDWYSHDPLVIYPKQLVEAGVATQKEVDEILALGNDRNRRMFMLAADLEISPYTDYEKHPDNIEKLMFSNLSVEKMEDRPCDVKMAKEDNERVKKIKTQIRYAYDKNGKPVPKLKQYNIRDGIFEAIFDKFYTDPTLITYGEDVRDWNGAFAVYRGMTEALPYHRLFNAPISESAIVGSAVGYGMAGGRVIVELMYCDFIGCAGDEIFNQMSKWQSMSAGGLKMPVVLRVSVGSKYGAQHSQDWTSLCAHIPGLKVVFPVTPYDAKGMMNTALNGTDPVVFFESQRIYGEGEQFVKEGVPEGYYEIPYGEPAIRKEGKDVTILTIGATLYRAMEACKMLEEKYGISAELIDARSVVPFNYDKVIESVKKTGKILLASDACTRGNILNDMAQNITQMAFDYLDAPPVVLGAKNWITPPYEFDKEFFPQPEWFLDAINDKLIPLKGHVNTQSFNSVELARKSKLGV